MFLLLGSLLKRLAICAAMTVVAPHTFAAVVVLEGAAPPSSASSSVVSEPERVLPENETSRPTQSTAPAASAPSDSGILHSAPDLAVSQPAISIAPSSTVAPIDLGAVKVANPSEVTVEMMPSQTVSVGSRVSFRVASKKAGYLVLIDVDTTGHLTQIYPNTKSLMRTTKPNGNYIKPSGTLTIPTATDPYGGVEYVVSPPNGQAMIVAVLSAEPVQLLDLPDVPPEVKGSGDTLAYLAKWVSQLRIPDEATSQLRESRWSFNAAPYSIH
jgi:hypothetical protein